MLGVLLGCEELVSRDSHEHAARGEKGGGRQQQTVPGVQAVKRAADSHVLRSERAGAPSHRTLGHPLRWHLQRLARVTYRRQRMDLRLRCCPAVALKAAKRVALESAHVLRQRTRARCSHSQLRAPGEEGGHQMRAMCHGRPPQLQRRRARATAPHSREATGRYHSKRLRHSADQAKEGDLDERAQVSKLLHRLPQGVTLASRTRCTIGTTSRSGFSSAAAAKTASRSASVRTEVMPGPGPLSTSTTESVSVHLRTGYERMMSATL